MKGAASSFESRAPGRLAAARLEQAFDGVAAHLAGELALAAGELEGEPVAPPPATPPPDARGRRAGGARRGGGRGGAAGGGRARGGGGRPSARSGGRPRGRARRRRRSA